MTMRVSTYPPDLEFGRAIIYVVVVLYYVLIYRIRRAFPPGKRRAGTRKGTGRMRTVSTFVERKSSTWPLHG